MARSSRIWLAASIAFLGIFSLFGNADESPYYLTPWRYGAIAWIEEEPADPAFFITRLDRTLGRVFSFWELDPIEPHPRWAEAPTWKKWMGSERLYMTEIRDYADRSTWKLPAPSWEGVRLWPLVVVVYPDGDSMRRLTGRTCEGWFSYSWTGLPGRRRLLDMLPALLVVHLTSSEGTLAHELTHWLTFQYLFLEDGRIDRTPTYLLEGMAELCEELFPREDVDRLAGSEGRWGSTLLDIAAETCLTSDLPWPAKYVLGESFVAYLITQLGFDGFWATLPAWAESADELVGLYEPGWRQSLGLPMDCGTLADEPE